MFEQIDRMTAREILRGDEDRAAAIIGKVRAAERARILASLREPDALERLVDAVTEAANIVSYDGYYEIDKEAAVHALDAALAAAADHMEAQHGHG